MSLTTVKRAALPLGPQRPQKAPEPPAAPVQRARPAAQQPAAANADTRAPPQQARAPTPVANATAALPAPAPQALSAAASSPESSTMAATTAIRATPSFRALPVADQRAVIAAMAARPNVVPDLREWTSAPGFQAMSPDQQRAHYAAFSAGALAAGRGGAVPAQPEQFRIAVVFPGQRASSGRGELADALRRAEQARRLFPDARVDFVIHDPPETASEARTAVPRQHRATSYLHALRGWSQSWDYQNQPLRHDRGINFIYATAPALGPDGRPAPTPRGQPPASENYVRLVQPPDFSGMRHVPPGQPLNGSVYGVVPSDTSAGMQALRRAHVVINAGDPGHHHPGAWAITSGERGVTAPVYSVIEPDHSSRTAGTRVRTTLSAAEQGEERPAIHDYDQPNIAALRARVAALTPGENGPTPAQLAARAEVLRQAGLPPDLAARLAGRDWAVGYHHPDIRPHYASDMRAWARALEVSARPGQPFAAFMVQAHPQQGTTLEGFGGAAGTAVAPGVARYSVNGGEVYVLRPQARETYQGLTAGSRLPNLVTGTNSLADALIMGRPIVYGALDFQHEKTTALIRAARPALANAGFSPEAITTFERALPRVADAHGNVTDSVWAAMQKLHADGHSVRPYGEPRDPAEPRRVVPTPEDVARFFSNPEQARAMFRIAAGAAVIDGSPAFRHLLGQHAPRTRQLTPGLGGLGSGAAGLLVGHAAGQLTDNPAGAAALNLTAGLSSQLAIDRYLASLSGNPTTARTLLGNALTNMPTTAVTSRVLAEALHRAGVNPNSIAFDAAVFAGTAGFHTGTAALDAYLLASGRNAAARALAAGGRVAAPVGAAMLADTVAGLTWGALDRDAEYRQQLGLLALRMGTTEGGAAQHRPPSAANLALQTALPPSIRAGLAGLRLAGVENQVLDAGRELFQAVLPTSAAASGLALALPETLARARTLIRDGAEGAELAVIARLAQAMHATTGASNGDPLQRFATDELGSGPSNEWLKLMRLAAGETRTGFSSSLLSLAGSHRDRPERLLSFIDHELPALLQQRAAATQRRLQAVMQEPPSADQLERAAALVRQLQLLSYTNDLRTRMPDNWRLSLLQHRHRKPPGPSQRLGR